MISPVISVVTPTFNMGDRLQRCIDSVAAQTYPHVEHIVVDGSSTDGSVALLEQQEGVWWVSEPDDGQGDAINKGFAMASGAVIGWLNADDTLDPDTLTVVAQAFEEDRSIGWVYGDLRVVSGDATWMEVAPRVPNWETMLRGNVIGQPGSFYARWALDRVGPLDTSFHYAMDYELFLRFIKADIPGRHLGRALATFELHEQSKSGSIPIVEFAEEEARALRKHGDPQAAALAIDRWYWDATIRELIELMEQGEYRQASKTARDRMPRLDPIRSRIRGFLWITRLSPRIARLLVPMRRTRR